MATNVIDSLVVLLGLDPTNFKKGQKEAEASQEKFRKSSEENTKKINAQSKVMADGFHGVKTELLGLVAVGLGAVSIKAFFENMVNGQASLGRTAKFIGMSARELDAWSGAAETVGGSAAGIQQTMKSIQAGIQAFRLGDSNNPVVAAFRAMKIDITDANHQIRPMRDLLLDISAAMQGRSGQDQLTLAQYLGADEGSLNLLRLGRVEVESLTGQLYKASGVTEASTEAAAKAQAKWALFKRELYGVGQTIFVALSPALDSMNENLLSFSAWAQGNKGGVGEFFKDLSWFVRGIATDIGTMWDLLQKVSNLTENSPLGRWFDRFKDGAKEVFRSSAAGGGYAPGADNAAGGGRGSLNPGLAGPDQSSGAGSGAKLLDGLEKQFGLPTGMLTKIKKIESDGSKTMVSPKGATGPFQIMPATAKDLGLSREETFDLEKSATAAAKYLAQLMKMFGGDEMKAVAAYNWGMGNVQKNGLNSLPKETQDYLNKYASSMPLGAGANTAVQTARAGNTTHNETHIGSLTVQTAATDARGIARDLPGALAENSLIPTYQTGMN